jgi:hypothetical protein
MGEKRRKEELGFKISCATRDLNPAPSEVTIRKILDLGVQFEPGESDWHTCVLLNGSPSRHQSQLADAL